MKKNKVYGLGIGTTSVILVFVIICLTILSALAYTIVKSDSDIIDKKMSYTIRYQMAENIAVDTLAKVDEKLYELSKKKIVFSDEYECKKVMNTLEGININYEKKQIAFNVGLDDDSTLEVLIKVNIYANNLINNKNRYNVLRWKMVTDFGEIGNDTLNIWH